MSDSKSFSILGKGLKFHTQDDIEPYLAELRALPDVEEIHLGGNTFGVEACQALAEVLKTKTTLKFANFADIFTGRLITEIPTALAAICDALIDNSSLVEIDLSDNAFGGRSAEPMVPLLSRNRHIQVIRLNNNGLGPSGGETIASALIESAKASKAEGKLSNLRTVVCGRNRLQNESAPFWAEAFALHGTLVEVRMPQNGIRMEGIVALAKGLSKCPMEYLDLRDNCCSDSDAHSIAGARALAVALPGWPSLRFLDLADCVLTSKGGMVIATALEKGSNPKLETLKLENDELDHRTFTILARAIGAHLPALTLLEINANKGDPEEDECFRAIRSALESHGHEDAMAELDEMEEFEELDEEEEPEEEEEGEPEAEEEKAEADMDMDEAPKAEPAAEVDDGTAELVASMAAVNLAPSSTEPTVIAKEAVAAAPAAPVDIDMNPESAQTQPETVPSPLDAVEDAAAPVPTVSLPPSSAIVAQPEPPVEPAAPATEASEKTSPVTSPEKASPPKAEKPAIKKRRSILHTAGDKLSVLFGKMSIGSKK